MQIDVVTDQTALAALAEPWNRLPRPSPMQSPDWLLAWWDAYGGAERELSVLVITGDGGNLVGLVPWYSESIRGGRQLRWLGDGAVCSDHSTILCDLADIPQVVDLIADWVLRAEGCQLRLESVDRGDQAIGRLVARLESAGRPVNRHEEPGACYIDLPDSWDEFLSAVSKNHRKRCRRWERELFSTGRLTATSLHGADECRSVWGDLVQLHNDRQRTLGHAGAFEDDTFRMFHESAIARLASSNQIEMRALRYEGQLVAMEYALYNESTLFAYQGGMSALGAEVSAGTLSVMSMVRDAIAAGKRRLDLLRGDEPYKLRWAARRHPAETIVVRCRSASGHVGAWCDAAWGQVKTVKRNFAAATTASMLTSAFSKS